MSRPVPKTYPGVKIQNIKVETSDFDYKAFMDLFINKAKPVVVIDDIVEVEEILEFTVIKKGMIVIIEKENVAIDMCNVSPLPVTDQSYYMNNRKIFLKEVKEMVADYKPNMDITCDNIYADKFSLLPHQKLVQKYLSPDTPYRGLLLYHGLGSGKTCSSIAIAEGLKPYKNIIVMTPKSLEMNYLQQLKKCGDPLYSLNQSWSWVQNPTKEQLEERCLKSTDLLSRKSTRGIWVNGGEEYDTLSSEDQELIKMQIDMMIHKKYKFIIYNGINEKNIKKYTSNGNPFSNNVVIVDEAHNFVSRILNVLKLSNDQSMHPSVQFYRLLMEAENCKVVMLSGTPMINSPIEIAVLFNMIRGYITVWSCKGMISEEEIKEKFPNVDVIIRKIDTIMVTQSPQGFIRNSKTTSVKNINYENNFDEITEFFKSKGGTHITKEKYKALPDNEEDFNTMFVKGNTLQNKIMLMSRIAGLTSFFPDLLQLMPVLRQTIEHRVPMSVTQFDEYKIARLDEKKNEKKSDKGSGSYRIQSRLLCNTTYPISARKKRPRNYKAEVVGDDGEEEVLRGVNEFFKEIDESDYTKRIEEYSPKYKEIIDVIQSKKGLQLLYSQFLNIEGIKLFSRVLESKGYTEFKLVSKDGVWDLDTTEVDKPMYIIYGGTKTSADKKELFRNIFNKNWEAVPDLLREKVKNIHIPLFMITSAGAEGISLMHVQYVHLMEPYWNPVRIDQVIGRARRICSHNTLPEKDRFVEVHLYLSVIPDDAVIPEGLKTDAMKEGDLGKVGSTDEYLYLLAQKKRTLSSEITDCIRNSSIDCSLYGTGCLSLPYEDDESMLFLPDIKTDITKDTDVQLNVKKNEVTYIKKDGERVIEFKRNELVDGFIPIYPVGKTNQIGFTNAEGRQLYDMNKNPISLSKALKL